MKKIENFGEAENLILSWDFILVFRKQSERLMNLLLFKQNFSNGKFIPFMNHAIISQPELYSEFGTFSNVNSIIYLVNLTWCTKIANVIIDYNPDIDQNTLRKEISNIMTTAPYQAYFYYWQAMDSLFYSVDKLFTELSSKYNRPDLKTKFNQVKPSLSRSLEGIPEVSSEIVANVLSCLDCEKTFGPIPFDFFFNKVFEPDVFEESLCKVRNQLFSEKLWEDTYKLSNIKDNIMNQFYANLIGIVCKSETLTPQSIAFRILMMDPFDICEVYLDTIIKYGRELKNNLMELIVKLQQEKLSGCMPTSTPFGSYIPS